MPEWVECRACRLRHSRREDGWCPRCGAAVREVLASAPDPGDGAATPPASDLDDEPARTQLKRGAKAAATFVGALWLAGWAAFTISDVRELEAGSVREVRVWRPAALLYEHFGMAGLVFPFAVMFVLLLGTSWWGFRELRRLEPLIGKDRAARFAKELGPTLREMRLFLVMVVLAVSAALYIWIQVRGH